MPTTFLKPIRSRVAYAAIIAWGGASLTLTGILAAYGARLDFVLLYLFYLGLTGWLLKASRRDLLSPPGLITITGFMTFGLSFPLIYIGSRHLQTSDVTSVILSDASLVRALLVFLLAKLSFIGGYHFFHARAFRPWLIAQGWARGVSIPAYVICVAVVAVAAAIRIHWHLGEAARMPAVPFAGVLQYTLFDGVLLLCLWFLAQGLRQSAVHMVMGLSLLLGIAVTQALLGWRGGVIQMIYVAIGVFWYQRQYQERRRPYSLLWLLTLIVVAGSIIQFGNEVRTARIGGDATFANSITELLEKLAFRSQGVTRLATILEHYGDLSWFNGFNIVALFQKGITSTIYIDRLLYAVQPGQPHSVGTSGPGGAYVALGMVGVVGAYGALGMLYKWVYSGVIARGSREDNIVFVVLYAYLMFILAACLSENFNVAFLKNLIAVLFLISLLRLAISRRPN